MCVGQLKKIRSLTGSLISVSRHCGIEEARGLVERWGRAGAVETRAVGYRSLQRMLQGVHVQTEQTKARSRGGKRRRRWIGELVRLDDNGPLHSFVTFCSAFPWPL